MNNAKKQRKIEWESIRDFFKKIGDIKEHFMQGWTWMDTVKDRNDKDITEQEEIKKQWQEHTEELYKKNLKTQITKIVWYSPRPEIIECEVK